MVPSGRTALLSSGVGWMVHQLAALLAPQLPGGGTSFAGDRSTPREQAPSRTAPCWQHRTPDVGQRRFFWSSGMGSQSTSNYLWTGALNGGGCP